MALKPAQGKRRAAFNSGLGEDKLVMTRFDVREGISEGFEIQIEALSEDKQINFDTILGTKCKIRIDTQDGNKRYFNGVLTEAQSMGPDEDLFAYRLTLRPWFWLLTKAANCKIFKDKNVIDIISEVLGKHSFATFRKATTQSYPKYEYCVQYCESDFDFLSRLMEENGIYYFYEHAESDHTLVLADSKSASQPKLGGADISFIPVADRHFQSKEILTEWTGSRRFCTGKMSLNDYNYMTPDKSLLCEDRGSASYENASLEVYNYPGRYDEKGNGTDIVKWRLEAEQALDNRCDGAGDSVSCSPGALIKLKKHPQVSDGKEFLILRASHYYKSNAYRASARDQGDQYSGRYEFLPSDIPFRSPQKTSKPRIFGPQTAFVDGEGQIDVDEHGRILVLFHWARDREKTQSRRVRISHGWSGAQWGDVKIPRVGMEVVVEFLNGDPDQPLVTGTVYNAEKKFPYSLPDKKTISGVKSQTEHGDGYNEFIFDDLKGDELVRLHAEKDLESKIEHDERREVGNDVTVKIGNDRKEKIGNQWTVEAGTLIEFKCGQSKITMTPVSITLEAVNINVKAQAMLSEQAPLTKVQGSGSLILQGGVVLIN